MAPEYALLWVVGFQEKSFFRSISGLLIIFQKFDKVFFFSEIDRKKLFSSNSTTQRRVYCDSIFLSEDGMDLNFSRFCLWTAKNRFFVLDVGKKKECNIYAEDNIIFKYIASPACRFYNFRKNPLFLPFPAKYLKMTAKSGISGKFGLEKWSSISRGVAELGNTRSRCAQKCYND